MRRALLALLALAFILAGWPLPDTSKHQTVTDYWHSYVKSPAKATVAVLDLFKTSAAQAQSPSVKQLLLSGVSNSTNCSAIPLGFTQGTDFSSGCIRGPPSGIATTRTTTNGTATAPNADGSYLQFADNIPRITTLGLWSEEARTNSIRNPIMSGAVAADGVELTTNGNFALNPINASQSTVQNGWQWTIGAGTGTVVYNSGPKTVTLTGDGTVNAKLGSASLTTVVGLTYTITADIGTNAVNFQAGTSAFDNSLLNSTQTPGTSLKAQFVATTTTSFVSFSHLQATASTVTNVSVQSAGKLPTLWTSFNPGSLIFTVTNVGNTSGLPSFSYTAVGNAASQSLQIFIDASNNIAALYGQTWAYSVFMSMTNTTNVSAINLDIRENNSGGTTVFDNGGANFLPTTTLSRFTTPATLANKATAFAQPLYIINYSGAVNFAGTIAVPQLEKNSINSTVASATIQAVGSGGTNGTAVYTIAGGTCSSQPTLNITIAGGVLSAINSVANAGSCTVLPPSPATLFYSSGTGTGLNTALVNLTPTSNSAQGLATTPILSNGTTAGARAGDSNQLAIPPTFVAGYSVEATATPYVPISNSGPAQNVIQIDNNTDAQRFVIRRQANGGTLLTTLVGGTGSAFAPSGVWAQNSPGKIASAVAPGSQASSFNGSTATSASAATLPTTPNTVHLGVNASFTEQLNGVIASFAINPTTALTAAQLQTATVIPPPISLDFANGIYSGVGGLAPSAFLTTTRTTTNNVAYANDASGNWTTFADNVPRITSNGILPEEARTNVQLQSMDMTNALYGTTNVTATGGQSSPDGGTNAQKLADSNTTNAAHATITTAGGTITAGATISYSAFFKTVEYNQVSVVVKDNTFTDGFNLTLDTTTGAISSTGTAGAGTFTSSYSVVYPNGWTRVCMTGIVNGSSTAAKLGIYLKTFSGYVGVVGSGVLVWQNQIEAGAATGTACSSPMKTVASTTTRGADFIRLTTPPTFGNAVSATTRATRVFPSQASLFPTALYIDNSSTTIYALSSNSSLNRRVGYNVAGVGQMDINSTGSFTAGGVVSSNWGLSVIAGSQVSAANGVAGSTGSGALMLSGLNRVIIGAPPGGNQWTDFIQQIQIWPNTYVPVNQLQASTPP